jgi:hypothetical protein
MRGSSPRFVATVIDKSGKVVPHPKFQSLPRRTVVPILPHFSVVNFLSKPSRSRLTIFSCRSLISIDSSWTQSPQSYPT